MQANSILFIDTVNELLAAMDKAERVIKEIQASADYGYLVDEVSDSGNRVTVLEPAILNLRMKQITNTCYDMVLIDLCRNKDPKRELVNEEGDNWHELAKGPMIVKAVKCIREVMGPNRVDIRDGKRIVELVQAGLL